MSERLRIVPLGGMGEVGRNLTVIEYGDDDDRHRLRPHVPRERHAGRRPGRAQLRLSAGATPTACAGYLITHGHEDHIGALPYVLAARAGTGLRHAADARPHRGQAQGARAAGSGRAGHHRAGRRRSRSARSRSSRSGSATPSPTAVGLRHRHAAGPGGAHRRVQVRPHAGRRPDDRHPPPGRATASAACWCCCPTAPTPSAPATRPPRPSVREALERVFERAEGRIIISTFASNISRVQEVINVAAQFGRKVGMVGSLDGEQHAPWPSSWATCTPTRATSCRSASSRSCPTTRW